MRLEGGGGCFPFKGPSLVEFIFHRELSRLIHNSETSGRGEVLLGGRGLDRTPWRAPSHHQTVTKTSHAEKMGLLLGKNLWDRFMGAGGAHGKLPPPDNPRL